MGAAFTHLAGQQIKNPRNLKRVAGIAYLILVKVLPPRSAKTGRTYESGMYLTDVAGKATNTVAGP